MRFLTETRQKVISKTTQISASQNQKHNFCTQNGCVEGNVLGEGCHGNRLLGLVLDPLNLLDDGDVVPLEHDPSQLSLRLLLGVQLHGLVQHEVHVLVETHDVALDAGIHLKRNNVDCLGLLLFQT